MLFICLSFTHEQSIVLSCIINKMRKNYFKQNQLTERVSCLCIFIVRSFFQSSNEEKKGKKIIINLQRKINHIQTNDYIAESKNMPSSNLIELECNQSFRIV